MDEETLARIREVREMHEPQAGDFVPRAAGHAWPHEKLLYVEYSDAHRLEYSQALHSARLFEADLVDMLPFQVNLLRGQWARLGESPEQIEANIDTTARKLVRLAWHPVDPAGGNIDTDSKQRLRDTWRAPEDDELLQ